MYQFWLAKLYIIITLNYIAKTCQSSHKSTSPTSLMGAYAPLECHLQTTWFTNSKKLGKADAKQTQNCIWENKKTWWHHRSMWACNLHGVQGGALMGEQERIQNPQTNGNITPRTTLYFQIDLNTCPFYKGLAWIKCSFVSTMSQSPQGRGPLYISTST